MSKIYKALEKAEKERERRSYPLSVSEINAEPKREREEVRSDLLKDSTIVSDERLVSFSQPGSLAAEQFRKLRSHLFRLNEEDSPKTIMVTSATDGEGKTFVAANLAINIAIHFHAHSLLIDCDLRKSQVAKWFNLENGEGLSDYLLGGRNLPDLLLKTAVEKLTILPGGHLQDNPTELIGSKRMEILVQELKVRYKDRFIIFDTTPLLATSEPEILAKLADGIIIVVRAGTTPRETLKQAMASLEKEKILGFVLNDLEFKSSGLSSRYFGSDGYYYRYGYGHHRGNSPPRGRWRKNFPFRRRSS